MVAEQSPTKFMFTTDGSKLANNIYVFLMGLKEREAHESMPLIGSHLLKCSHNLDAEVNGTLSVQKAFLLFPILAQLGPESGDLLDAVLNIEQLWNQQPQTMKAKIFGFLVGKHLK